MTGSWIFLALCGAAYAGMRVGRKSVEPATDALIPYETVLDDGATVAFKNGMLMRMFEYGGPDGASMSDAELAALARRIEACFAALNGGWIFHFIARRERMKDYPGGQRRSDGSVMIDEERRSELDGGLFLTRTYLSAAYMPPSEILQAAAAAVMTGETPETDILESFSARTKELADRLSVDWEISLLQGPALEAVLSACVSGAAFERPPGAPTEVGLDSAIAAEFIGGFAPRIGGRCVRTVAPRGYPEESFVGMLDAISGVDFEAVCSTRWIPLPPDVAASALARVQDGWRLRRRTPLAKAKGGTETKHVSEEEQKDADSFSDGAARQGIRAAGAGTAEARSGEAVWGHATPTVTVFDESPDSADEKAQQIIKQFRAAGFRAEVERVNAVEALIGSWPGCWANIRRPLMSSRTLFSLVSTTGRYEGPKNHPCDYYPAETREIAWVSAGEFSTGHRLMLHEGDVGHMLVVGPNGSGKSSLFAFLASQVYERVPGARIISFDFGRSLEVLTRACGGSFYEIAPDGELQFQPLRRIDSPVGFQEALDWVGVLIQLQTGEKLVGDRANAVESALRLTASRPAAERTLDELGVLVQDEEARRAITSYTSRGPLGGLLDGSESEEVADGDWQVFELGALRDLSEKFQLPIVLMLIRRIERLFDGRPTILLADEFWNLLAHPVWRDALKAWLVTARKRNVSFWMATQSPAQLGESLGLISEQALTRIVLPNPMALGAGRSGYEALGLSEEELGMVAAATPKQDYFVMRKHRMMMNLRLGKKTLALMSARRGWSMEETLKRVRELDGSPDWVEQWVREHGEGNQ